MYKKILLRVLSVLMFSIFVITLLGMFFRINNGESATVILFFQLFLNPKLAIENWLGAVSIASVALIQFFFFWAFFYLGKSAWVKSNLINASRNGDLT